MIIDFYIDNDFSKNQRPQQVTVRCSKDEFFLTIKNQNRDWKEYKTTGLKTFGEIVNWVKSTYSQTETGTFNGLMSLDIFARNKSDNYENRGNLVVKELDNKELRLTYCPFKKPVIIQTLSLDSNWENWAAALKDTDKIWEEIEDLAKATKSTKSTKATKSKSAKSTKATANYTVKIRTLKDALGTNHYLSVPLELAKATVACHKDQMTPGGYWGSQLATPTRRASRRKDEFVEVYTGGLATGELGNMLHRSTEGEVVFENV